MIRNCIKNKHGPYETKDGVYRRCPKCQAIANKKYRRENKAAWLIYHHKYNATYSRSLKWKRTRKILNQRPEMKLWCSFAARYKWGVITLADVRDILNKSKNCAVTGVVLNIQDLAAPDAPMLVLRDKSKAASLGNVQLVCRRIGMRQRLGLE